MSNDIVARLRDCTCVPHGEICREAADEIERLRRDYSAAEQDHVDGVARFVALEDEFNLLRARIRRLVAE